MARAALIRNPSWRAMRPQQSSMTTRREFVQVAAAVAAVTPLAGRLWAVTAQQRVSQEDLLRFTPKGQVTILHLTDCHAQLRPIYYREPSASLGVDGLRRHAPHLTGADFLSAFGIVPGSLSAYALTSEDYEGLARTYGKVGGMGRMATLIRTIRAERGANRTLLLDGGDTLQGSYTALKLAGADMIAVLQELGAEATTGHWEFTLGSHRIAELFGDKERPGASRIPFLAANVVESDFAEPVFNAVQFYEKGGVRVAVVGQAFPYTPIANPRWMMPTWSFGIREDQVRKYVSSARAQGAEVVILLSHNGFNVDRKLAARVAGIDVILTGHTHDALPLPVVVGNTLLIASGSHGKFLSRLDIEVKNGHISDYAYALIPVLADAITPDPAMSKLIGEIRGPYETMLSTELARTESLLYRRGSFNGTFDDLICEAMLVERDSEISLSPGFRWGATLLPGQAITWDDVYNATAITYPACYRRKMSGGRIKELLEDVADNLFNPNPYYQQGGDMVRAGGLSFTIHVDAPMGRRISNLTLQRNGQPIAADREYVVAGWASVNEGVEGPPIWDVVARYVQREKVVRLIPQDRVKVLRDGG
jgi:sulfur-oxidizing protein SoxB